MTDTTAANPASPAFVQGEYYAVKHGLRVGDRILEIGECIPEAHTWKDVASLIANGSIAYIPAVSANEVNLLAKIDQLESRISQIEGMAHAHNQNKGK